MVRRSFLQNSIIGTIGASLFKSSFSGLSNNSTMSNDSKCYMSESGIYGKDSTFVMGFLVVDNWQQNEDLLINNRSDFGYRNVLTYRSNDRYKVDYAKSMVDLFSQSNDFQLYIKYSDISSIVDQIENKLTVINDYKIDLVNDLVGRIGQSAPSSVITKYQSLNGPSESFRNKFKDMTLIDHQMMVTRDSNLLQLSSFLTSTVAAIINDKINHPIKFELSEYFKNNIGIQNFDHDFSINNIHFYK